LEDSVTHKFLFLVLALLLMFSFIFPSRYEQVNAVVATFPHPGNGPVDDDSVEARLNGLKWLATYGQQLPAGVERILVMDATDLEDLPLTNDDPQLPRGVDVEKFWAGEGRRPTRVLLRRGSSAAAQKAAQAAAQ
jgi:hypothetical protein